MRPVERGPRPLAMDGAPIQFNEYGEARDLLIYRIGCYCSYCEMPRPESPDVEHVQPKKWNPALTTYWGNFLLACRTCNSIKGDTPVNVDDFLWPDRDNTWLAFRYQCHRGPQAAAQTNSAVEAKAAATIGLLGLDRQPGHPSFSQRDRRWLVRIQTWDVALLSLNRLYTADTPAMRAQIVETALAKGFWSVWMTVFESDRDMQRRLRDAFPGTAANCWDIAGNPAPRPGGVI